MQLGKHGVMGTDSHAGATVASEVLLRLFISTHNGVCQVMSSCSSWWTSGFLKGCCCCKEIAQDTAACHAQTRGEEKDFSRPIWTQIGGMN